MSLTGGQRAGILRVLHHVVEPDAELHRGVVVVVVFVVPVFLSGRPSRGRASSRGTRRRAVSAATRGGHTAPTANGRPRQNRSKAPARAVAPRPPRDASPGPPHIWTHPPPPPLYAGADDHASRTAPPPGRKPTDLCVRARQARGYRRGNPPSARTDGRVRWHQGERAEGRQDSDACEPARPAAFTRSLDFLHDCATHRCDPRR